MVKYTKISRERMDDFLTSHSSSLSEAAKLAGTSRATLTRHLEKGLVPAEWMEKIREGLKGRKPVTEHKPQKVILCALCGKDISDDDDRIGVDTGGLRRLGAKEIPKSGYYWFNDEHRGKRIKMFRICRECLFPKDKKKKVRAKVTVKHD